MTKNKRLRKNPPVNPESTFRHAANFEYSADTLVNHGNERFELADFIGVSSIAFPTAVPWIVLSTFSLELYLKCLIQIEKGRSSNRHEIVELFRQVTPDRQALIRKIYQEFVNADPMIPVIIAKIGNSTAFDFDHVLQTVDKAFIEWRYYFETNPKEGTGAQMITLPVKHVILEIHPEWRAILNSMCVPPPRPTAAGDKVACDDSSTVTGCVVSSVGVFQETRFAL